MEASVQEAMEKGLAMVGRHGPLEPVEELGTHVVLSPVAHYLPNWALMSFL